MVARFNLTTQFAYIGAAASLFACSADRADDTTIAAAPIDEQVERNVPDDLQKELEMKNKASGEGIENLPYARGKTFHSLDEYLAHLKSNAAIDLPYWQETAPGEYEWMTSMRSVENGDARETATREELLTRYGFEK